MSSNKFLLKALNAVSAIALSGVLLGFTTSSVLAMEALKDDDLGPQKSTLSIKADAEEEKYDTRISLLNSPLWGLDKAIWLKIMALSLGNKQQLPLAEASRYFHNLSCDGELSSYRTLTIKTPGELKEMLASRNPSRAKNSQEDILGYELPHPLGMHLALKNGRNYFDSEQNKLYYFPFLTPNNFKEFLDKYTSLTQLTLEDNYLYQEEEKILGDFLSGNTCLRSLSFKETSLENSGVSYILAALVNNKTLTALEFDNIMGKEEGILNFRILSLFTKVLSENSTLRHLSFKRNSGTTNLIPTILKANSCLTSIHLSNNVALKGKSLEDICGALSTNSSLKKLGFSTMSDQSHTPDLMQHEDVVTISKAIRTNSSLTSVDLSGTEMSEANIRIITNVCNQKHIQLIWNNKKREVINPTAAKHRELDLAHGFKHGFKLPYNTFLLNGFPQSHK